MELENEIKFELTNDICKIKNVKKFDGSINKGLEHYYKIYSNIVNVLDKHNLRITHYYNDNNYEIRIGVNINSLDENNHNMSIADSIVNQLDGNLNHYDVEANLLFEYDGSKLFIVIPVKEVYFI